MPGIGVRTGARILIDVGDGSEFPSAAHLAAYAGLAPATRSSGSSIRGEQPPRRGNKQLERQDLLQNGSGHGGGPTRAPYSTPLLISRRSLRVTTTAAAPGPGAIRRASEPPAVA
ncbi:hypothetical protein QFZ68_007011 [Streptomyces sp. V1I6]|nr:hypothetical protein [Streptomyces sp. V1I6]